MKDCDVERIQCEDCGNLVLSGDIRYDDGSGKDLCEYCFESYESDEY